MTSQEQNIDTVVNVKVGPWLALKLALGWTLSVETRLPVKTNPANIGQAVTVLKQVLPKWWPSVSKPLTPEELEGIKKNFKG